MTNPSPVTARAAARAHARQQDLSPLHWWRQEQAPELPQETTIAALRTALTRIALLGLTDYRAAADGNDVTAVRIALRLVNRPDTPTWLLDWAGSALLLCTMQGSLAAAVTLAHLRRRHGVTGAETDRRA